jgi:hypothetical protein
MTEIQFWGYTFVGTAEGDHGVFTHSDGDVYAGQIADGSACVGVLTYTDGSTVFAECDADGKAHGRRLDCYADGDTWYRRYDHGSYKESALLSANGTCKYNGRACRADYAPFVALRAMVLPIKARPRTRAPSSRLSLCRIFYPAIAPQSVHRPLFWQLQELATTHADKVRARRLCHQPARPARRNPRHLPNKCTARPTGTTHRAGRVHYACDTNHVLSATSRRPVHAQ